MRLISGLGISPRENGNPLQNSSESPEQRSLQDYSSWGGEESDKTE